MKKLFFLIFVFLFAGCAVKPVIDTEYCAERYRTYSYDIWQTQMLAEVVPLCYKGQYLPYRFCRIRGERTLVVSFKNHELAYSTLKKMPGYNRSCPYLVTVFNWDKRMMDMKKAGLTPAEKRLLAKMRWAKITDEDNVVKVEQNVDHIIFCVCGQITKQKK